MVYFIQGMTGTWCKMALLWWRRRQYGGWRCRGR